MGCKRLPYSDWRQLEGTPERKIKGRFDELSKKYEL
jgi:16S rRNA (cytosine967-C5)-methyltransferase